MKNCLLYLSFLILTLAGCKASSSISSKQINSGKVTFAIDIDTDNEIVKEKFGTQAIIEFNSDLLKFTKNDEGSGFEFQLIDLKNNQTWNYLNFLDNKFRVLEDETMTPKMGTPVFHDVYETIAGFKCQKMTAPMGDGEMTAYINKEITINYCPYLKIDGFALKYELPLPFGTVTYTTTQFEQTNPTLSIDNNYTTYSSIKEFQASLEKNTTDLIGQKIPDLNMVDINGNYLSTTDLKDKITVFIFWFTACAPCITEIPDLNKLKEKYKNQEVEFAAITFDEKNDVQTFLEKHPFDFAIFSDQKEFINQLKIRTFPTTFITDKSGNIIHSESGGSFSIFEDLSTVIDTALKK